MDAWKVFYAYKCVLSEISHKPALDNIYREKKHSNILLGKLQSGEMCTRQPREKASASYENCVNSMPLMAYICNF
jgi:hypothetical protein